ncbi:hypothetical protein BC834DRAFT_871540 [Gloeopeniophorella convolvens]|nr:hypothetical protein BC834DRAFT_871540 [Gloeopeniophorella convolvens]
MSFLIGPVSGALVAGGVYYGFSNLIESRTEQHRKDLHVLARRLITPPAEQDPPPSAADRITHSPFTSIVKQSWNDRLGELYGFTRREGERAGAWGRKVLYGGDADASETGPSQ